MKVRLTIDVEIKDSLYNLEDDGEKDFLFNTVLKKGLLLHSNEIGDTIGEVTVINNTPKPNINIEKWLGRIIHGTGGFKNCEKYEAMLHHISREYSIAEWVIRCLANPECEGSNEVIEAIIKQRSALTIKETVK